MYCSTRNVFFLSTHGSSHFFLLEQYVEIVPSVGADNCCNWDSALKRRNKKNEALLSDVYWHSDLRPESIREIPSTNKIANEQPVEETTLVAGASDLQMANRFVSYSQISVSRWIWTLSFAGVCSTIDQIASCCSKPRTRQRISLCWKDLLIMLARSSTIDCVALIDHPSGSVRHGTFLPRILRIPLADRWWEKNPTRTLHVVTNASCVCHGFERLLKKQSLFFCVSKKAVGFFPHGLRIKRTEHRILRWRRLGKRRQTDMENAKKQSFPTSRWHDVNDGQQVDRLR